MKFFRTIFFLTAKTFMIVTKKIKENKGYNIRDPAMDYPCTRV